MISEAKREQIIRQVARATAGITFGLVVGAAINGVAFVLGTAVDLVVAWVSR